nr:hypothetical protein [Tanacetum cinerariifolium]
AQCGGGRAGLAVLALFAGAQAAGGLCAASGAALCRPASAGRAGQRLRPHELGQNVFHGRHLWPHAGGGAVGLRAGCHGGVLR